MERVAANTSAKMISLIGRLLGRTKFEWRLYFVRKGVGLEYALHNKSAWGPLGYLHGAFERGCRISDVWKLYMSYYTGSKEDQFQLTEAMFTDPAQFKSLMAKCEGLDKDFHNEQVAVWDPYFMHVPTRMRLPLGGPPTDANRADIQKYLQRRLAEKDEGVTFSKLSAEVFVEAERR